MTRIVESEPSRKRTDSNKDVCELIKIACPFQEEQAGQLDGPSSYLMKSPMHQRPDSQAQELTEAFIKQYARKPVAAGVAGDQPAAADALAGTN